MGWVLLFASHFGGCSALPDASHSVIYPDLYHVFLPLPEDLWRVLSVPSCLPRHRERVPDSLRSSVAYSPCVFLWVMPHDCWELCMIGPVGAAYPIWRTSLASTRTAKYCNENVLRTIFALKFSFCSYWDSFKPQFQPTTIEFPIFYQSKYMATDNLLFIETWFRGLQGHNWSIEDSRSLGSSTARIEIQNLMQLGSSLLSDHRNSTFSWADQLAKSICNTKTICTRNIQMGLSWLFLPSPLDHQSKQQTNSKPVISGSTSTF